MLDGIAIRVKMFCEDFRCFIMIRSWTAVLRLVRKAFLSLSVCMLLLQFSTNDLLAFYVFDEQLSVLFARGVHIVVVFVYCTF